MQTGWQGGAHAQGGNRHAFHRGPFRSRFRLEAMGRENNLHGAEESSLQLDSLIEQLNRELRSARRRARLTRKSAAAVIPWEQPLLASPS